MKDINDIKEALRIERGETVRIRIKGYFSSGSGTQEDLEGEIGVPNIYRQLVSQSHDLLAVGTYKRETPADFSEVIDTETWEKAAKSQLVSYEKLLNGETDGARKAGHINFTSSRFFAESDSEANVIYIHDLYLDTNQRPSGYKVNSRPMTVAKAAIRAQLPTGRHVARLRLEPGKFDSFEILS